MPFVCSRNGDGDVVAGRRPLVTEEDGDLAVVGVEEFRERVLEEFDAVGEVAVPVLGIEVDVDAQGDVV